jgi:hypothetical protein
MKVKFGQLQTAIDFLRNKSGLRDQPNVGIDVSVREENPEKGVLGDGITLCVTVVTKPSNYDDYKTDTTTEYVVEVFSESENRPPRMVSTATRELI